MSAPTTIVPNSLEWPDYVCIALYFSLSLIIGWWAQRRKNNTGADYFLGGGRVPP